MDISEIEKITSVLWGFGAGAITAAVILYFFFKSFIPSYLSEKGKNLATKEDIASITDKVESIKTDYAKVIEEIKSNNQLKLAEIDRERNIRKEVYLEATEALTRTLNVIGNLANLEIEDQDINNQMNIDSGSIAKVQIVGSTATVKSVTTIMGSIGAAIMELMLERSVLKERKKNIDFLRNLHSKSQSEVERYIAIMKNLNLEGNKDPHLWKTLNENIKFETKQRDELQTEIDELWEVQNKEHLEFTNKCMSRFFEISRQIPGAVLSVRDDLNLPISSEEYVDINNKNIELGEKVFGDFFKKMSDKLA